MPSNLTGNLAQNNIAAAERSQYKSRTDLGALKVGERKRDNDDFAAHKSRHASSSAGVSQSAAHAVCASGNRSSLTCSEALCRDFKKAKKSKTSRCTGSGADLISSIKAAVNALMAISYAFARRCQAVSDSRLRTRAHLAPLQSPSNRQYWDVSETFPVNAESDVIAIHGAREHNLKNISLEIPRGQLVVITGVSGSGKSTLAFDLLFAEGQRRFLDSMNLYARQFVEQLPRPEVDLITGIPPSVSIEQRQSRGGGKSTVATVTEIYHFLRLLFARLGVQFCPRCNIPVQARTRDEAARLLRVEMKRRGDLLLLAPVVKNRKGFHSEVAEWAAKHGYKEVRADGKIYSTAETFRLDRFREHDVGNCCRRSGEEASAARID